MVVVVIMQVAVSGIYQGRRAVGHDSQGRQANRALGLQRGVVSAPVGHQTSAAYRWAWLRRAKAARAREVELGRWWPRMDDGAAARASSDPTGREARALPNCEECRAADETRRVT